MAEASKCEEIGYPYVKLNEGLALIPLDQDYLFLVEGDETPTCVDTFVAVPEQLSKLMTKFTESAYIEAEFLGGDGTQASVLQKNGQFTYGPEIFPSAINASLRRMGIEGEHEGTLFGFSDYRAIDPFDKVGLGRNRSIKSWLREASDS